MADTTLKRVPGIAVVLSAASTLAGTYTPIGAFESLSVDMSVASADASAANADFDQMVLTRRSGKGSITGFVGSEFPQTLNVGDEFYIKFLAGTSDVSVALKQIKAATNSGKCRVLSIADSFNKDPGKVTINFQWGFID